MDGECNASATGRPSRSNAMSPVRQSCEAVPLVSNASNGWLDCQAINDELAAVELLHNLAATGAAIFALGGRWGCEFDASKARPAFRTRHIALLHTPTHKPVVLHNMS
jgi:hypothetical protein